MLAFIDQIPFENELMQMDYKKLYEKTYEFIKGFLKGEMEP